MTVEPADPGAGQADRVTVTEAQSGQRLDKVLAALTGRSRAQVQQLITAGVVEVDGDSATTKSQQVAAGQAITVGTPTAEPVEPPPPVAIRWADEHLAVVAKPADLVVHDGAGVRGATLVDALLAQGVGLAPAEDPTRPGIVHRLDRGTSGVLVVALSAEAMDGLQRMFRAHDVEREYWALVEGQPDPATATIDAPIRRSSRNRTTFTTGEQGRDAVTHFTTTAVHPIEGAERHLSWVSEVAVTLETGRTHQVRVHMRAIGHPVAGDTAYGGSAALAARLRLPRQALHARRLAFAHPVTGAPIEVVEPLPEDLRTAVEVLRPAP